MSIIYNSCKNDFFWNRNAFKHELEVLEKVRHPNVVQFVGAVTQNIPMMIVSEYHPTVNSPHWLIFNCSWKLESYTGLTKSIFLL